MKCKCSQLIACHIDSTMTADMSTTWALLSAVPSAKPLDSGNVDAICIQRNESNGRNRSNRRHGATPHQRLRNLPPMQNHAQIYAGRTNYSSHHYSSERCIISPTPIHACAHTHVQIGTHISHTYNPCAHAHVQIGTQTRHPRVSPSHPVTFAPDPVYLQNPNPNPKP